MKEFDINGKVLFFILFFVIAISSIVFSTTLVGTSGSSAVPNYNDKVVVATTTSFIADVSNGYKEPLGSAKTKLRSSYSGSSSGTYQGFSGSTTAGSTHRGPKPRLPANPGNPGNYIYV